METGLLTVLKYKFIQIATLGCSEFEGETSNRITILTNGMTMFALVMAILINLQMYELSGPWYSMIIASSMAILPLFIFYLNHRHRLFQARLTAYFLTMITGINAAIFFGKSFNGYYLVFLPLFYSIIAFSRSRNWIRLSLLSFAILMSCVIDWLSHNSMIPVTGLHSKDFPLSVLIFDTLCFTGLSSIMIWVEKTMADRHELGLTKALDEIARQKTKLKTIFDNVDVGILSCNHEGKIEPDYSRKIREIFPEEKLEGRSLIDVLFSNSQVSSDQLSIIKNTFFVCLGEDTLNWEMNKDHLIKEIRRFEGKQSQYLKLTWSPLVHDDLVAKIIVSVEDVTNEKINERRFEKEKRLQNHAQNLAQVIIRSSTPEALQLIKDMDTVASELNNFNSESKTKLMHHLHSLKGNTRLNKMDEVSNLIHDLETAVSNPDVQNLEVKIEKYLTMNSELQQVAEHLFGKLSNKNVNWTLYKYLGDLRYRIEEELRESDSRNQFQTLSIDDQVWDWPEYLHKPLQNILTHGIQNSIDHGYLLADLTKPIHISVKTRSTDTGYCLFLEDYGNGLNQNYIQKQWETLDPAIKKQLKDREDLLFIDSHSSAKNLTKTSGRGVGLSAIKSMVEELDGEVQIKDHPDHRGTQLSIFIPKKDIQLKDVS